MNIPDTIKCLTFKVIDETEHFANITTDQDKPVIASSASPMLAEHLWAAGYRMISASTTYHGQPRFFCEKLAHIIK